MKPTRPANPYIFFLKENQARVKEEHKCGAASETAKILGEQWKAMNDEQKKPYLEKQAADQTRYEAQCREMKDKGYFTLPDGSKSSDHKKKVPVKRQKLN